MARKLIKFMFFQNEKNLNALGKSSESIIGILLSMKIGEESKDEKSSSDVETLLNSV